MEKVVMITTKRGKNKMYRSCKICGELFYLKPSLFNRKFMCSWKCSGISIRGRSLTEEQKKKISLSSVGKNGTNLGKKFSKEHKDKIRKSQLSLPKEVVALRKEQFSKIRMNATGKDNPAWKGGVSKIGQKLRTSKEYIEWRTAIVKRDGFRCKNCGHINVKFEVHHIESFAKNPEKRLDINNGITYCKPCHRNLHRCLTKQ